MHKHRDKQALVRSFFNCLKLCNVSLQNSRDVAGTLRPETVGFLVSHIHEDACCLLSNCTQGHVDERLPMTVQVLE